LQGSDPECKRSRQDLGLAVKRAVVGVFRHHDMGYQLPGRQAAFDQPCWCRCRRLDHPFETETNNTRLQILKARPIVAVMRILTLLAREATAKDFVSDAFAHAKFIAYCDAAGALWSHARIDVARLAAAPNLASLVPTYRSSQTSSMRQPL
jgi:hypothetical protein